MRGEHSTRGDATCTLQAPRTRSARSPGITFEVVGAVCDMASSSHRLARRLTIAETHPTVIRRAILALTLFWCRSTLIGPDDAGLRDKARRAAAADHAEQGVLLTGSSRRRARLCPGRPPSAQAALAGMVIRVSAGRVRFMSSAAAENGKTWPAFYRCGRGVSRSAGATRLAVTALFAGDDDGSEIWKQPRVACEQEPRLLRPPQ
jgi:hypothetical protein